MPKYIDPVSGSLHRNIAIIADDHASEATRASAWVTVREWFDDNCEPWPPRTVDLLEEALYWLSPGATIHGDALEEFIERAQAVVDKSE